jgi:rsbT co-antagonist protein RsbR
MLLPIPGRILVLPLAGEMTPARVARALERIVTGAAARRARVVVIDVSGARRVEAGLAIALTQAAAALRPLGAQVVATGICPEAAQALAELGVDLSVLVTRRTLQSGLACALELARGARRCRRRVAARTQPGALSLRAGMSRHRRAQAPR